LVVAALVITDGETMLELAVVSDGAIVTLFLQVGSFDRAQSSRCRERERQHADDYGCGQVSENSFHWTSSF
jgi:hypothetical protein